MSPGFLLCVALLGSVPAWQLALRLGRAGAAVAAVLPLGLFLGFLSHWGAVVGAGGAVVEAVDWVPSLGVGLSLRLDGFSLLFCLLITGIGTLVVLYAGAYFAQAPARGRARFVFLVLVFMGAMLGTVLSDDLVALFVFWEATSLTSFMLIGFEAQKPEARRAALQSLLVTAGGGLALLAGILLLGAEMGTFSLTEIAARSGELAQSPLLYPILALILLGAATKSAQFPFHFWLPGAMAAPTPASAYLHSATMVKLGVYLLARFDAAFAQVPAFGASLVVLGSLTMAIAALNAIRATGYKAVLAWSTVASLGILVMLIGLDGPVAAVATAGFILAHAAYKAALFFCAGTAIHATHEPALARLGGLARFLPLTAAAAVLASLSMAGLPPFVGFIAKEYLFEAQLESGWNALPVVVAVLVNAVMVAVAGAVTLRPFFLRRDAFSKIHHGETPGLLAGPLLLGGLGIVMGVFPGLFVGPLVGSAAVALYGAPFDTSFSLWHGLTPMLGLSALAVALGVALFLNWERLQGALGRSVLRHFDADRAYQRTLDGTLGLARWTTRTLQNGDQRHYTAIVAVTLLAIVFWVMLRTGSLAFAFGEAISPVPTAILALALAGALVATRVASLVTALIGVGIVGYGSALLFLLNGAPDLALTQFAVETLVLVVTMAVLVRLPGRAAPTRTPGEKRFDAGVAALFSLAVFLGLSAMLALPLDTSLSDYFGATSYALGEGRNVVNVILVDYRALDTMGEIAVVGFATLGAWALLRRRKSRED